MLLCRPLVQKPLIGVFWISQRFPVQYFGKVNLRDMELGGR